MFCFESSQQKTHNRNQSMKSPLSANDKMKNEKWKMILSLLLAVLTDATTALFLIGVFNRESRLQLHTIV
jgi:hypothetical protein